ncbi:PEPxxWA-CTERM sorting domain-containing protein [Aquisediminimonas profunda]|uniref:PEPxxWA-CTERM sorting domain-containing protein n=1 Tax=Aquisediminimonas profunda TaxID=1550733 RepID=UPI001FE2B0EB|nr:PEPxxWA-CTERM sorting domain-containing protein [Aquisediminimonas profunda]
MRVSHFLVAAAAIVSAPANAATIIQTVTNNTQGPGFIGFDQALGKLDNVQLSLSVSSWRAYFLTGRGLFAPGSPTQVPFDWSINGSIGFSLFFGQPPVKTSSFNIPITGAGSTVVDIISPLSPQFETFAKGFADLTLNPADFVTSSNINYSRTDPGLNNSSLDTLITTPVDLAAYNLRLGNDFLSPDNNSFFSAVLTYNYTAVPEPTTWAMMLLGFGLVGSSMRRARPRLAGA